MIQKPALIYRLIISFLSIVMEEKSEIKMGVHQILTKNGFYRLPMHSLTEILKLLEMPESLEPKTIQENAINGILKIIQKHSSKYSEFISASKAPGVSKQTKEYVNVILHDSYSFLTKKSVYQQPQPSTMYPSQMGSGMPGMGGMPGMPGMPGIPGMSGMPGYPPMGQYSYMRPPSMPQPGSSEAPSESDGMKMMDEQMRMQQQMYMYYYGMYGLNPMFNPGYMNPYGPYGQMPSKPTGSGGMPMGPMGPMNPMTPLGPIGGLGAMGNFTPKPPSAPSKIQQNKKEVPPKETETVRTAEKAKNKPVPTEQSKPEKTPIVKSEQKRKGSQKSKLVLQNPPFTVTEVSNGKKSQSKASTINQLLRYCACKGAQKYQEQFLCSICNRTFHFRCLNESIKKLQTKESIQCYHCRLRFIDPLNRVKEVIAEQYIPNINENKFYMTCNLKPYQYLCRPKGGKNQIQMRCLKVSSGDVNEITWPDQCIIKLNGERIIEIPALQINSSLKKRKDYSIIITQNIYNKANETDNQALQKVRLSLEIRTLTKEEISHRKIKNNFTFAFAIYFVERLTVDELYQKIVNEQKIPESPDYLQKLMRTTSNEIEIDKIIINLYDPFTWDVIKTPVRGYKCVHGQCFDLKTYISFMSTARNRTWKCPVCGKDTRKFMIDSQQQELLKRVQETNSVPSEITFMKDGTIVLKVDNHSDEDELVSSSKQEKTKKIHKQAKEERNQRQSQSKKEEVSEKEPRDGGSKENQRQYHEQRDNNQIEEEKKQPALIVQLEENDEIIEEAKNNDHRIIGEEPRQ